MEALRTRNKSTKSHYFIRSLGILPRLLQVACVQFSSEIKYECCFRLPNEDLEAKFIAEAAKRNLAGLKGHRSVGGMRASIYNAVTLKSVQSLVDLK